MNPSSGFSKSEFGYPKTHRLLSQKQFKTVFDGQPKKVHQSHLLAFCIKTELDNPRLGLAITKKKVPTAVARNNLKRLIREDFRKSSDSLNNLDIVFIVKKPIKDLDNIELKRQINIILNKFKINDK